MAITEGFINVTEGSGKKAHTSQRTIGANDVHDEFVLHGEYPYASYFVSAQAISVATSSSHVLQIMAGSSLNVRIRRIYMEQEGLVTSANSVAIQCLRLTTAGTGGSSVTPAKFVNADAASGATAMTLPSAAGTESTVLFRRNLVLVQTFATAGSAPAFWEWQQDPRTEPILIAAGTSNGIALKVITGRAGATVNVTAEIVETNFV